MAKFKNQTQSALFFLIATSLSFYGLSQIGTLYGDFMYPYGVGVSRIPRLEMIYYLWYFFFGLLVVAILTRLLHLTSFPSILSRGFSWCMQRPRLFLGGACFFLMIEILFWKHIILLHAPISGDELTYEFIAQTLLRGYLTNPLVEDVYHYANSFVVVNEHGWYGKYPIGHSIVLALGMLLQTDSFTIPTITCINAWLTFTIAKEIHTTKIAIFSVCLLLISPQFIMTGATSMSQPTSTMCMLLGTIGLLYFQKTNALRWVTLSAMAFGFGVLVRPLPGVLILGVGAIFFLRSCFSMQGPQCIKAIGLGTLIVGLWVAFFFFVNYQQNGDPLITGYYAYSHMKTPTNSTKATPNSPKPLPTYILSKMSIYTKSSAIKVSSIASALLRQNFWLFGWPLSFCFLLFSSFHRKHSLFWSMIAAVYMYRLIAPKTVIATTGPIYVAESIPFFVILSAYGMQHYVHTLKNWNVLNAKKWMVAFLSAMAIFSLGSFIPHQAILQQRGALAWKRPFDMLHKKKAGPSIIFSSALIPSNTRQSWCYPPPNPHPALKETFIFVKKRPGPSGAQANITFWKKHFPDRQAWIFEYIDRKPLLRQVFSKHDFLTTSNTK